MIVSNSEAMVAMDMPAGPSWSFGDCWFISLTIPCGCWFAFSSWAWTRQPGMSCTKMIFHSLQENNICVGGLELFSRAAIVTVLMKDPDLVGVHSGKDMEVLKLAHWPDHKLCSPIFTLSGCCCGRCRLKCDAYICVTLAAIDSHFYIHAITCVLSLLWRTKVIIA